MEHWREWLYPLGFISSLAFSARMLVQWLKSEAAGRSLVTPLFWKLSLIGNITLAIHSLIQVQFHVCVIQICNGIISWRNLNLMGPTENQITKRSTLLLLMGAIILVISLFFWQGDQWFRLPITPWEHIKTPIALSWHLFGFIGLTLFSSRFWIQWWNAEKHKKSVLGAPFWWTSLIGEMICLLYFLKIHDPVNYLGPAFAMIPYIRNLMLLKTPKSTPSPL